MRAARPGSEAQGARQPGARRTEPAPAAAASAAAASAAAAARGRGRGGSYPSLLSREPPASRAPVAAEAKGPPGAEEGAPHRFRGFAAARRDSLGANGDRELPEIVVADEDEQLRVPAPGAAEVVGAGGTLRTASGHDYVVERHLGSGAFGHVWLCRHEGELRAVKVVPMSGASDVAKEVELSRSGAKLGGVGYGHVPKFFEAAEGSLVGGSPDPVLMIVMEYIDGVTLGKALTGQKLPEEIVKVISVDLLRTLARLHEVNFVHRDVKPDNIILNRHGFAYLCDFGVSRFVKGCQEDESVGEVVGTPMYMAPEVQLGRGDCRVDVWSAGMTLFEMLNGSNPILDELGESAHPAMYLQHLAMMPAPSVRRLKVSNEMKKMLHDCLQRNPDERASAKELLRRRGMRVGKLERSYTAKWCQERMHRE